MITKKEGAPKKGITKKVVLSLIASFLLAGLAGCWGIPYAQAVRGYSAVGGEYCLMVIMGVLPWVYMVF